MCHRSRQPHRHSARSARTPESRDLRASDAERERTDALLRASAADGRLSYEELEQRLEAAAAATYRRDLDALTADLPRTRLPQERRAHAAAEVRGHVRSYVFVMVLLVAIWALSGAGYFWPVWPMLGWGIGVASHVASARPALRAAGRARPPLSA